MRKIVLFVVLSITTILLLTECQHDTAGIGGGPTSPSVVNDTVIMPVNRNNYWTYSIKRVYHDLSENDTTITFRLDSLKHWNNTNWCYYAWIGLWIQNCPGGLWSRTDSLSDSTLYLKYPVEVGDEWDWMSAYTTCLSKTDTVFAMNRTYYNCIRYRTQFTSGHYTDQVMKPGIGLLCTYTDTSTTSNLRYRVTKLTGYHTY